MHLLVMVLDCDILRAFVPGKRQAPLVVHAYAVIAPPPLQSLEVVAWRLPQILWNDGGAEHPQFPPGRVLQISVHLPDVLARADGFSPFVLETLYHWFGLRTYYNEYRYIVKRRRLTFWWLGGRMDAYHFPILCQSSVDDVLKKNRAKGRELFEKSRKS